MKIFLTKEILEQVIKESQTIADCIRKLDIAVSQGTYSVFRNRVKKWNIDTSHFLTQTEIVKQRIKNNDFGFTV